MINAYRLVELVEKFADGHHSATIGYLRDVLKSLEYDLPEVHARLAKEIQSLEILLKKLNEKKA